MEGQSNLKPIGSTRNNIITFTVFAEPFGKQRPRFCMTSKRVYTPKETVANEMLARQAFFKQCKGNKLSGMIGIKIVCYFAIPKSTTKKNRQLMINGILRPVKKFDADNLAKLYTDSINGIAFDDDAQIVDMICEKWYSEIPRVEVMLWEVRYGEETEHTES